MIHRPWEDEIRDAAAATNLKVYLHYVCIAKSEDKVVCDTESRDNYIEKIDEALIPDILDDS